VVLQAGNKALNIISWGYDGIKVTMGAYLDTWGISVLCYPSQYVTVVMLRVSNVVMVLGGCKGEGVVYR
jgi:hypothetical protein